MKQKHFLTVMAVLDEKTQYLMNNLQQRIIALGDPGTQTMGIPFHISLGSFPLEKETEVLQVMREIAGNSGKSDYIPDRVHLHEYIFRPCSAFAANRKRRAENAPSVF